MILSKLQKLITLIILYNLIFIGVLKSEVIEQIRINGNDRISNETMIEFEITKNRHVGTESERYCLLCEPESASHLFRVCHSYPRFDLLHGIKRLQH